MSDKEVIQMIIDKLDRQDDKLDKINDKLTDVELQTQTILTAHEIEIKRHEKEIEDIKKELFEDVKRGGSYRVLKSIVDSPFFILAFRISMFLLACLFVAEDKLKVLFALLK